MLQCCGLRVRINILFAINFRTQWSSTTTDSKTEKMSNCSRLLVVKVDENAGTAQIVWSHDIGFYTPHFGDCDKLATGNILGVG